MRFAVLLAFVLVCGCDDASKRAGAPTAGSSLVAKPPRAAPGAGLRAAPGAGLRVAPGAGLRAAPDAGPEEVPFAKLDAIASLDEAIQFCLPMMEDTTGAASGGADLPAI